MMFLSVVMAGLAGAGAADLEWLGANPSDLKVCQGDCDTDANCPGDSQCTQRVSGAPAAVHGCGTGDSGSDDRKDTDYCNDPAGTTWTDDKISNYDLGKKWSGKCISIADWHGKNLGETVKVTPRMANGCCPPASIPGVATYQSGQGIGPMVVCHNGGKAFTHTAGTDSKVMTCTYGDCYVVPNSLKCKDGKAMMINGCCGDGKQDKYDAKCVAWNKAAVISKVGTPTVTGKFCTQYAKTYINVGSSKKDDDIHDEKLKFSGLKTGASGADGYYYWTPCAGSGIPPDGGSGGGTGGNNVNGAHARTTAAAIGLAVGAAMLA